MKKPVSSGGCILEPIPVFYTKGSFIFLKKFLGWGGLEFLHVSVGKINKKKTTTIFYYFSGMWLAGVGLEFFVVVSKIPAITKLLKIKNITIVKKKRTPNPFFKNFFNFTQKIAIAIFWYLFIT